MLHQATIKKAEKMGVSLSEDGATGRVDAHWVEHNVHAYGFGQGGTAPKAAVNEIEAVQKIKAMNPEWRIVNATGENYHFILVFNDDRSLVFDRAGATPIDTLAMLREWTDSDKPREWMVTAVPEDGGEAYRAGFTASDNPFKYDAWRTDGGMDESDDPEPEPSEEDENARAWDESFDEAADAAEEPEDEEPGGSVVKPEYRARYAEAGHPNHCGDWLANLLNELVLGKTATDLQRFEDICAANGVDTSKYKRSGNGWQGRLRMTGRNLLAKRVFEAGHITIPANVHPEKIDQIINAPGDWMDAQRFKGKKAKVEATPAKVDDHKAELDIHE